MDHETGRAKLQALQEAEYQKKKRKTFLALACALAAIVAVTITSMFLVNANKSEKKVASNTGYVASMQSVPSRVFDAVGRGNSTAPITLKGAPATAGTPTIRYFGGEYCPFCAMQRWSLVSALSRFGTWQGLEPIASSEDNIPTVDFTKAKFSSPYVKFTGYELKDQNGNPLMKASPEDQALMDKYDTPEYIPGMDPTSRGAIPFVTYGDDRATSGAMFNGAPDMMNTSGEEIAKKLTDPHSATSKNIVGAANVITATICSQNGDRPKAVCSSEGVKAAK